MNQPASDTFQLNLGQPRNMPDNTLPQVPAPNLPVETPFPSHLHGECALFCEYGYATNCSCNPDPSSNPEPWNTIWEQEGGEGGSHWVEINSNSGLSMAVSAPHANPIAVGAGVKSKTVVIVARPALQERLCNILLDYCDRSPDFAAAVLPMLKDGKAKIGAYDGFVHIVNGNKIIRFAGKAAAGKGLKTSQQKSWAYIQAAEAVITAINTNRI